jgi:hypothetical protein
MSPVFKTTSSFVMFINANARKIPIPSKRMIIFALMGISLFGGETKFSKLFKE